MRREGPKNPQGSVLRDDLRVRHEGDQGQEHEEADRVDLRLDLRVGLAAREGLEEEEDETAAVEGGDGQQVEAAEVRAEAAEELQVVRRAAACRARHLLADADGARELGLLLAAD